MKKYISGLWRSLPLQFELITTTQRYSRAVSVGRPDLTDANPMTLVSGLFNLQWSGIVPETDVNGHPTGQILYRRGGDGDYRGNEIYRVRLDQISGGVAPAFTNLATDATTAQQWRNKIHTTPNPGGGTAYHGEMMIDMADLTSYQPSAGHIYGLGSFFPGIGYIETHKVPVALPLTPETNPWPYAGQVDMTDCGLESKMTVAASTQFVPGIDVWSLTTGKWSRGAASPAIAGFSGSFASTSDYNPVRNEVVQAWVISSGDRNEMYSWQGGAAVPAVISTTVQCDHGGGLTAATVAREAWTRWLDGSKYLLYEPVGRITGVVVRPGFKLWDAASPATATALRGVNGNAVLDTFESDFLTLGQRQIEIAIDHVGRRVFWLVPVAGAAGIVEGSAKRFPFRVYRSSIDNVLNFTEVALADNTLHWLPNASGQGLQIAAYYGGFLYVFAPGVSGLAIQRLPV